MIDIADYYSPELLASIRAVYRGKLNLSEPDTLIKRSLKKPQPITQNSPGVEKWLRSRPSPKQVKAKYGIYRV